MSQGKGPGPGPPRGHLSPNAVVHWLLTGLMGLEEEEVGMERSEEWVPGIVELQDESVSEKVVAGILEAERRADKRSEKGAREREDNWPPAF